MITIAELDGVLRDWYRGLSVEMVEDQLNITINNSRESGKTIIDNKSKLITTEEIESVLKLLHPTYADLGVKLRLHKNKLQAFFQLLNPFNITIDYSTFKGVRKGMILGVHCKGEIDVFPYNCRVSDENNKRDIIRLHTMFSIIHEIRHAYQRIHKKNKFMQNNKNYVDCGNAGYSSQWIERDANHFSQRFMNNNKEEICRLLDIKIDWDFVWGTIYYNE